MCTYVTSHVEVGGSASNGDDWFPVDRAVVYFDHPQDAPLEHALCVDVTGPDVDAGRIALELDAASARRLAETILTVLDDAETRALVSR